MFEADKLEGIINEIVRRQDSKHPLELIVGFEKDKKGKTVKQLSQLGRVTHTFESLPYSVLKCEYSTGRSLANFFFRKDYEQELRSAFSQLNYVNSLEIPCNI